MTRILQKIIHSPESPLSTQNTYNSWQMSLTRITKRKMTSAISWRFSTKRRSRWIRHTPSSWLWFRRPIRYWCYRKNSGRRIWCRTKSGWAISCLRRVCRSIRAWVSSVAQSSKRVTNMFSKFVHTSSVEWRKMMYGTLETSSRMSSVRSFKKKISIARRWLSSRLEWQLKWKNG